MTQQFFGLPRIVSGGQTGADQAGLFAARDLGFETGGWAPKEFLTEDGPNRDLLSGFGLKDSGLPYAERTYQNVKESSLTLWFGRSGTSGYHATARSARMLRKPFIEADLYSDEILATYILQSSIVNVAGNRASHNPEIFNHTRDRLVNILSIVKKRVKQHE